MHNLGWQGQDEIIAIIDTGWNDKHPDLLDLTQRTGKYREGQTIIHVEDLTGGDGIDRNFHSTWIHGALGAAHNGYGVKGRCPKAKFIIMKGLDDNGSGDIMNVVKGIYKAVDIGATQINLSIGLNTHVPELQIACDYALSKGCWVHAAAGNDYGNPIDYPAKYESVLAWGSHNEKRQRSRFSDKGVQLDVYAPGEDVLSTFGYSDYALNSGTSMAAPNGLAFIACIKKPFERELGREMTYDDLGLISDTIKNL